MRSPVLGVHRAGDHVNARRFSDRLLLKLGVGGRPGEHARHASAVLLQRPARLAREQQGLRFGGVGDALDLGKKDHVNQVAVILETHELPVVRDLTPVVRDLSGRRVQVSQL